MGVGVAGATVAFAFAMGAFVGVPVTERVGVGVSIVEVGVVGEIVVLAFAMGSVVGVLVTERVGVMVMGRVGLGVFVGSIRH